MTKRKVTRPARPNGDKKHKGHRLEMHYTSTLGVEVIFLPMPPLLREKIEASLEKEWPRPEPPTYTIKTTAGVEETHPHDETTLETEEDKADWAAYKQENNEWDEENSRRMLRAIQLQCIKLTNQDDTEWIERQEFLGIDVPENKFERHLHYIETEVIGNEDDIMACMTIPMQLAANASDEDMAAAEKLFRDAVAEEKLKRRTAFAEG